MTVYILSTMTGGNTYPFYEGGEIVTRGGKQFMDRLPVAKRAVRIHGGAGLPSLNSGFGEMSKDDQGYPIWTTQGVITPISDEAYAFVKDQPLFRKHMEGGYLKIIDSDIRGNHAAVAKEVRTMEQKDGSAQLTPASIKQKIQGQTPSVRTGESDDTWGDGKAVRIKG